MTVVGRPQAPRPVWNTARVRHRSRRVAATVLRRLRRRPGPPRRVALRDPLTGLGNRVALQRVLDAAGGPVGLVFLDLDGFRTINDTVGHEVGDALLVAVSERLRAVVRPPSTVVRLGGDQFAVVCLGADADAVPTVADRCRAAVRLPVFTGAAPYAMSACAGVASGGAAGAAELTRQADIALHVAKAAGRDRVTVFRPAMRRRILDRLALRDDLAAAVTGDAIEVHYQPILDLSTGQVRRMEALARWSHPARGAVGPAVFVPLAEEAGLMAALGARVLGRACAQTQAWRCRHPAAAALEVAVNVSPVQLADPTFPGVVSHALASSGLDASALVLEVTEGALIDERSRAGTVVAGLIRLGVRIAVDDFGTGHSSLARLRDLPVHELKIDRSFVLDLDRAEAAQRLAAAIVALGHSLGLEVVAEGVEQEAHLTALISLGCTRAQGFLLGRPAPAAACEGWLARTGA